MASRDASAATLRERAERIDAIATRLRDEDDVPPDVLTPIHVYAVTLREQARALEAG